MIDRLAPQDTGQLAAIIRAARSSGTRLEVVAGGSRRGYGRPVEADTVLDVSGLTGVVDYDPAELVLTARPGTPMREIAALLAAHGQHLAFEPGDLAPLWGGASGSGTLGGALACGLGGSRRPSAGAPRDHFLGFEAVNGMGEVFSAGGKVIKNVTGYDLPKLLAGSFGTLAVMTEVTVKVLPAPPHVATLALERLAPTQAIAAMGRALNSAAAVSGAAYLPNGHPTLGDEPLVLLRLEGVRISVAERIERLRDLLAGITGRTMFREAVAAAAPWADLGAVHPFANRDETIWRVVLPPSAAMAFITALPAIDDMRWLCDWGGGLLWLFLPPADDGHAASVRAALAATAGRDGHATLFRAPDAVRLASIPFQPLEPALAALTARVKARFDPDGIFNPGRLYEGL
jgi:glycolate oxidase FAD binding subunit